MLSDDQSISNKESDRLNSAKKTQRKLWWAIIVLIIGGLFISWMVYKKTADHFKGQMAVHDSLSKRKVDSTQKQLDEVLRVADTAAIKESFEQIDSSITRINRSLTARGLGVIQDRKMTVDDRIESGSLASFAKYYQILTHDLESRLLYTPLGMPYDGPKSSGFGRRHDPFFPDSVVSHLGLDFVGAYGDTVRVTGDGTVRFAAPNGGYGNCIIVTHSPSFETLYGHLSKILVKPGDQLKAGDIVGLIGSTGRSTGPHLHYEVWRNSVRINPERFLKL